MALGLHLGITLFAGFSGGANGGAMLFGGDVGVMDGIGHGGLFLFVLDVGEFGVADVGAGLDDGIGQTTDDEADGAGGIVIGRDREGDEIGVIGGIAEGKDRDAELVGFGDGVVFKGRVDEDDGVGALLHVLDTAEVPIELGEFLAEKGDFFFGEAIPSAIGLLGVELVELLDAGGDGAEVGEGSA